MKIPHWPETLRSEVACDFYAANNECLRGAMQTLRGGVIPRAVAAELAHIVTGTYDDAVVDNIAHAPTLRAAFDMADSYLREDDESDAWALAQLRMDVLAYEVRMGAWDVQVDDTSHFEYLNNRVKELEAARVTMLEGKDKESSW